MTLIMPIMEYEGYTFTIPEGGMLFVYTDGVAEARNDKEELYSSERIGLALWKFKDLSAKEIIHSMGEELDSYKGSTDQFDDITMLVKKR